jgi:chlorobactene glucosyltransferase
VSLAALTLVAVYGLVVLFWVALNVLVACYSPRRYFLDRQAPRLRGDEGPRVSILLAAKDEAGNVGACIRSVRSSDYQNFELIVIDDRSSDGTAAEAEAAAGCDPRVRVLRVHELPAGWTGKMNAIQQGLNQATGAVVLIIDADSRHRRETLGTAVAALLRTRCSLLSLLPKFDHRTLFSKLVQPMVGSLVCIWKPLMWINTRNKRHVYFAWGGFLMVRRDDLEAVGGLAAVKDRFAADIALAGRIKQSGRRIRVYHAPELVSSFMYASRGDILRGWTRLLRITADNRPLPLGMTLAALVLLGLSSYAALGAGLVGLALGGGWLPSTVAGLGGAHLALQMLLLTRLYRISGSKPGYALGHLPGMVTTCYLTALALLRCGTTSLTWRGTQYQLHRDGRAR